MKEKRQNKIKEIIELKNIETQDELLLELVKAGFSTTQATISRDIRELKLTKVSDGAGKQKYAIVQNANKYYMHEKCTYLQYYKFLYQGLLFHPPPC